MKLHRSHLAAAILFALPLVAFAHTGHGDHTFIDGFTHPFLGLDHLLAMLMVGVWSVLNARSNKVWLAPATFVSLVAVGAFLGQHGNVVAARTAGRRLGAGPWRDADAALQLGSARCAGRHRRLCTVPRHGARRRAGARLGDHGRHRPRFRRVACLRYGFRPSRAEEPPATRAASRAAGRPDRRRAGSFNRSLRRPRS